MDKIAERLKYLRQKAHFTQKEIATKLNISQQAYSRYEQGIRRPNANILISFSDLFGLDVNDFYIEELKDYLSHRPSKLNLKKFLDEIEIQYSNVLQACRKMDVEIDAQYYKNYSKKKCSDEYKYFGDLIYKLNSYLLDVKRNISTNF
jgi:transcriptional regulator with XRE-family HTH domain